jgi:hypothetical protein
MPRWKPAYRLVLEDGKEPLLQGWAVVDNVSGEHWQGVTLSLVSGSPISFRYNLHAPQYNERADLTPVGLPRAVAPPPAEASGYAAELSSEAEPADEKEEIGGYGADDALAPKAMKKSLGRSRAELSESMPSGMAASRAAPAPPPAPQLDFGALERQGDSAEASRVGALFRYDVRDRVTIPDRSSTLVNIVNQRVAGEQVAYFRPELARTSSETHPYRAVKLDNATGLTLERGPITVYSSGTFVGEGFVERLESGQTAFVTFAIDAEVLLDQKGGMREEGLRLLRIVDGQIVSEVKRVQSTTYEVKNRRRDAVRAFIRSPRQPGWTLRDRVADTVETPEALIVPLAVPAGKSATLEVAWEQPVTRTVAIDSTNADELLSVYLEGGKAPPKLERLIRELMALKAKLSDQRKELALVDRQHALLSRDTERVRDNLNVLRRTQGNDALQRELSGKLAQLERDLGRLSGQRVSLSEQIADLEKQLTALVRGVSLDAQ